VSALNYHTEIPHEAPFFHEGLACLERHLFAGLGCVVESLTCFKDPHC
jgi:hypothetical protein